MLSKIMETLNKNFYHLIKEIDIKNQNELYVEIEYKDIKEMCNYIYTSIDCSLISLFANDESQIKSGICLYYAFAIKKIGVMLIIKSKVFDLASAVDSISHDIPSASLYEREIKDQFGIIFAGQPDEREFVFHENWPAELHPLKKEFPKNEKPPFMNREQSFVKINGTGVFEIPVGPVHAGIIEPGHFRFSVAGEPIINLEAKLFYVHKGIEKLSENQNFQKVLLISERISGDETYSNSLAYCLAIEKIAELDAVPVRAQYARTVFCELERIYNHLGDISGICIDVAYGFAANQFAMMRRWGQMLNEELTGSRFLRSVNKPGGLRKDFLMDREELIVSTMIKLQKEFNETVEIIKSNSLFIDRVENTGVLKNEIAADLNAVGPAGRASGINSDVRRDYVYAAYGKMNFSVPVHNNGDVNCRLNTKIEEVNESIKIVLEGIGSIPEGNVLENIRNLQPYKYAFGLTESPRGENCHWVMTGEDNTIYRYKIRTPSFCNWPALCHAVKGNIVPDFPLINKSFNLSYAGNDL